MIGGSEPSNHSQSSPPEDDLWSILVELAEIAKKDERRLRQILRPHEEAGLTWELDAPTIRIRERLDRALNRLTFLEIAYQVGQFAPVESPESTKKKIPIYPIPARESLETLADSEAFLHYCDSYLYFAVRFLAERLFPAVLAARGKIDRYHKAESNWRPFALAIPPYIQADAAIVKDFFNIQNENRTPQEEAALRFLDGFLDKPLDYELWLRGLLAEFDSRQEIRFSVVTAGLERWLERRVAFYLSLARRDAAEAPEAIDGDGPSPLAQIVGGENATALGPAFSPEAIFNRSPYGQERTGILTRRRRPAGGWTITDPVAARLGLADIYWIARLLRATVTSSGSVNYEGISWLHLLRFHANLQGDRRKADAIAQGEEVIRSVFDFVCDLIQNAIGVTAESVRLIIDPDELAGRPPETKKWRFVFDEELAEITAQRALRHYRDMPPNTPAPAPAAQPVPITPTPAAAGSENAPCDPVPVPKESSSDEGWSERIKTGRSPLNLVGIACSGGGIRSATFNLGVLQGLQEFDLLRNVDYISTVSGGGFIGSWLVANVRRSAHWLGRVTDWSASIAHLRAYSNYLAPRSGILSADSWTMAASWARNAFLIQLSGLVWLFVLLLSALGANRVFQKLGFWSFHGHSAGAELSFILAALATITTLYHLRGTGVITGEKSRTSKWVRRLTVLPVYLGAFSIGSLFWRDATTQSPGWICLNELISYSSVLCSAWRPWSFLLAFTWIALTAVALLSLRRSRGNALWVSTLCTGVLYLGLAAIFYLDRTLAQTQEGHRVWYAFVFSPALVLLAFALSIVLFIGFTGRNSSEGIREWWTRFGAWLAIYALAGVGLAGSAAFGPQLMTFLWALPKNPTIKWASVLSWAGTVLAGLFAGKSSKTGEGGKSFKLQALAVAGGTLFIIGAVLLSSSLLYFLLFKIFAPDGANYDCFLTTLDNLPGYSIFIAWVATLLLGTLFSWFFEINIFGLNQFYRNRIVRCYLGASRTAPGTRKPNPFTGFDFNDDIKLHKLHKDEALDEVNGRYRGPFPIINCALNLGGSADLSVKTRHSASFFLTPLRCGADRPSVGYAPTRSGQDDFAGGIMLGQAVAVSGAAVSPNMGYNTSPLVAFLLTMFDVRLGWWFPNPGQGSWMRSGLAFSLYYLTRELLGLADERRHFLNVSDGGHFENLAVYELVRRRCKVIIACDAECDESLQFGGLGNLIRTCETDFGAIIELDVKSIRQQKDSYSLAHCAIGQIKYSNGSIGHLIYFKASMTGDEPVSVAQYRSAHMSFPHETTANQFFSEDQFESYRKLGQHIVAHSLRGTVPGRHPVAVAEKLADVLAPAGCLSEVCLKHNATLSAIWDKFRQTPPLYPFLRELMGKRSVSDKQVPDTAAQISRSPASTEPTAATPSSAAPMAPGTAAGLDESELCLGLQLIQLMEDVFLDLRLDDFWEHPDNRGWAILFMSWSRSARFRRIWGQSRQTFGIRFEHFCAARLGLPRDRPTIRV